MRSYETARKIYSFLEFVAWAGVVLGAIVAIGGASAASSFSRSSAGLIGALPGIVIMISGVFLVGSVQSGRANVDSAEYGQQMLQLARDQLEVSRRALKKDAAPKGFEPPKTARPDDASSGGGYAAAFAGDPEKNETLGIPGNAFAPIDAGRGFTQLNADATEFGYCDRKIRVQDGKFNVDGELFESLDAVQVHIDRLELPNQ